MFRDPRVNAAKRSDECVFNYSDRDITSRLIPIQLHGLKLSFPCRLGQTEQESPPLFGK